VALGRSSIRLAYTYAVYRAVYTRVILDQNGQGYIQLAYTPDMRLYIHLHLPLARAAIARAIVIISIYRIYVIL
jgi:hypothetical protein